MRQIPQTIVFDASIAVKLFIHATDSMQARTVYSFLVDGARVAHIFVPDLLYFECANAFWKYVRQTGYATADACQDLRDLLNLPFMVIPGDAIVDQALEIACRNQISVYDASYVALADHLKTSLVTADQRLAKLFAGSSPPVELLADYAASISHQ